MHFRYQLRYLLIRSLRCSHAEADQLCRSGAVAVDGQVERNPRCTPEHHQEISVKGDVIRSGTRLRYVLFYKPHGYECTRNRAIEDHMYQCLPAEFQDLFPLGRLDKNSEGLLLLTNDGQVYKALMDREAGVEKEYRVHTYRSITPHLHQAFSEPFLLGQRYTLPARFEEEGEHGFRVVLTEGINRQIRRICAKCDNQVKQLVRIRFGNYRLGDMQPGEWREVERFG